MRASWAILVCSILLLGAACRPAAERSVVATVNGRPITATEFRNRLSEYRLGEGASPGPAPADLAVKRRVLNELIEENILMEEARGRDIDVSQEELEAALQEVKRDYPDDSFEEMLAGRRMTHARWKDRMRTKITIEKTISTLTKDVPAPSEEKVEEYYLAHDDVFREAERFHIQQIVLKTEDDGKAVLAEMEQGSSFEELARRHSLAPEAVQGGDLGFVTLPSMPRQIQEVIPDLKPGEVSGVLATEYGYHVLRLMERRPARQRTLDEARPRIVAVLTEEDRKEKLAVWRRDNLSNVRITRNNVLLENTH